MDCYRKLKEKRRLHRLARSETSSSRNSDGAPERSEKRSKRIRELSSEIADYVEEVYDAGAELNGFQQGFVNFPSRRNGRIVYLCWKYNEESVEYWHETHEDCLSDRAPIEDDRFSGN